MRERRPRAATGRLAAALLAVALMSGAGVALKASADGGVAVALPLSGRYAPMGATMRAAIESSDARLRPGNPSAAAPLSFDDDACDAATAVETATRIVAKKPDVVIGHPCSSAAIAAARIYAAAGIPFIAVGARHPELTTRRAGPLVFRLAGRDDRQGEALARLLQDTAHAAPGAPVAILHDRTYAMSSLAGDVANGLAAAGIAVTQYPFVAGELSYAALVARIAAPTASGRTAGAVVFAVYPPEASLILRELRAAGVTAPVFGTVALATADLASALKDLPEPNHGTVRVLIPTDRPEAESMSQDTLAARAAAAVQMWHEAGARVNAAVAAGDTAVSPAQLLQSGEFRTAAGPVSFDPAGDARVPSYDTAAWNGDRWVPEAAVATRASRQP